MRYTTLRGLTQVRNWVKLKFAAMNLKKLAKRKWKERYPSYLICFELLISNYLRKNPSFAQAKLGFLDSLGSPHAGEGCCFAKAGKTVNAGYFTADYFNVP